MSADLMLAPVDPAEVYEDAEDPSVGTGWQVRSLESAEFALRRIGEMKRQIAGNLERKKTEIARIEARCEQINAPLEHGVRWFEAHLRRFAETERERLLGTGKKKSIDLLYGSFGWRKAGGGLVVKDEAALLRWAKVTEEQIQQSLTRTKVEPAVKDIRDYFKHFGEVPDGCEVEPERDEFFAKGEG